MGKRKSETIHQADEKLYKKRKKHHSHKISGLAKRSNTSSPIDIPELPSGLSKGQRKRWRRQQRKRAKLTSEETTEPQHDPSALLPSQCPSCKRISSATGRNAAIDQAMIHKFGTTQLPAIARPQWRGDGQSSLDLPMASANEPTNENVRLAPECAESKPHLVATTHQRRNRNALFPGSVQLPSGSDYGRPSAALDALRSTRSHQLRHSFSNASNARPSFSQKPTSVPAHSEDLNVAASFRRFTAFLRGRNADSDDGESDEASETQSESSAASPPPLSRDAKQVSLEQAQSQSDDARRSLDHALSSKISFKTGSQSATTAGASALTTSSPNSRRANVGIKRHSSSPGTALHTRIKSADPALFRSALPFSSAESDTENNDDLFNTIDEISREVFNLTRPLPACKSPASLDLKRKRDQEDGLMTSASSFRRVTRSMSTPKELEKSAFVVVPFPKESVVACYSAHVPDLDRCPATRSRHNRAKNHKPRTDGVDDTAVGLNSTTQSLPKSVEKRVPSQPDSMIELDKETDCVADEWPLPETVPEADATPSREKRKMTGMTSKHFTPERRKLRKRQSAPSVMEVAEVVDARIDTGDIIGAVSDTEAQLKDRTTRSAPRKQRKGTGRKSTYFSPTKPALDPDIIDRVDFYNTTAGHRNKSIGRVPAGTSTAPVPPITSDRFGIIQEKLWQEPFWLLIAVTFLNKTTGRAAVPVFWALKKEYETPERLAAASQADLEDTIWHLGLQRQRSRRLIKIAQAWIDAPPAQGIRWRTLHYPSKGDGKCYKPTEIVEDAEHCAGALEIGHIPGCGPYAWDSWRIFCRDVLRGVAHDYNGSEGDAEGFEPEWKRVLPGDKELRACLRWMWLREGYIWNCETGEKRQVTVEEMERAVKGEMEFADEKEKAFAARAAGVDIVTPVRGGEEILMPGSTELEGLDTGLVQEVGPELENAVDVITPTRKGLRRSARLTS